MKKNYRDTCEEIKLIRSKLAETEHTIDNLHSRQASLGHNLSIKDHDLKIDAVDCLPLRSELNIDTRGGPIVKIPFRHSS